MAEKTVQAVSEASIDAKLSKATHDSVAERRGDLRLFYQDFELVSELESAGHSIQK